MAVRIFKNSFGGGEVSKTMYARIDDTKNQAGLATCKNFIVEPQGPVLRRPGFEYVNSAKYADRKCRLIPFLFSLDQTMVLEVGHKYIRFHTQKQTLMNGSVPYEISTPYDESDIFELTFVQSIDVITIVHTGYPVKTLKRYGALDWRLEDVSFNPSLSAPTGLTVTQTISSEVEEKNRYLFKRKYVVTALNEDASEESVASSPVELDCSPYADGAYNTLTWNAVSGASLYRVYRSVGGVYSYIGQTSETTMIDDAIDPSSDVTPPKYETELWQASGAITSVSVVNGGSGYADIRRISSVQVGPVVNNMYPFFKNTVVSDGSSPAYPDYPVVTAKLLDASGSGSGAEVKIVTYHNRGFTKNENDNVSEYTWASYTHVKGVEVTSAGAGYVSPYIQFYKDGKEVDSFDSWPPIPETPTKDLITIETESSCDVTLSVTDSTGSGAKLEATVSGGSITSVSVISGGSGYTSPVITAASPTGSGATFSATIGEGGDYPGAVSYFEQRKIFAGSRNKPQYIWMTSSGSENSMAYHLPLQATDRISARIYARDVNRIKHIVPLTRLILLTASGCWAVGTNDTDALTPESISFKVQNAEGASSVMPAVVNSACVYAAARGGHLRELGYSYERGGFVSNDLCLRAPHLFDHLEVVDLAYSKAPNPIIWSVSGNGVLVAFTYIPEEQIGAFSTVETKGLFESITTVSEGYEDVLYAVVKRTVNGATVRYIERMHEFQVDDFRDYCFLDCAGLYSGDATQTVSGLDWLEGETVSVFADGCVIPNKVVKDGKIQLEEAASKIYVGLPYDSDLVTLPISLQMQDLSYGSSHRKNVTEITLRLNESSGVCAGSSFEKLYQMQPRSTEYMGLPPNLKSGVYDLPIKPKWSDEGQVYVRQSLPLPLRITSMTTVVEVV